MFFFSCAINKSTNTIDNKTDPTNTINNNNNFNHTNVTQAKRQSQRPQAHMIQHSLNDAVMKWLQDVVNRPIHTRPTQPTVHA